MQAQELSTVQDYDMIFTHTCLQHTNENSKRIILPRIRQALKPTGILVLEENANDGNTETTYTREGWRKLIEPFGFQFIVYSNDSRNGFVFRRT
jgi:chemotaxis methyl-accepting protein methylase